MQLILFYWFVFAVFFVVSVNKSLFLDLYLMK
ncbi:hypothetical protein AB670_04140 [Chryseobacterium sp. MOF25P]|uniref:Uncharacterized protein n=1 Tax=Chryseobacterium balustinum TaxID=246 RepID=A0ABY1LFG3_9FLAO|nr:hypothetical protein AB670_04140 [Chryseobacterium sp. MOF25P]OBW44218.1 hypothetical protein AB671_03699 [Chryseobacterium sp. BGARF1]SKB99823.1 hypothetical protein SAMN05421800_11937 [Chryseobacterium balustinum]